MLKSNLFEATLSSKSKTRRKIKLVAKESPTAKYANPSDYYFGNQSSPRSPRSPRSPSKLLSKKFRLNTTSALNVRDVKENRLKNARKFRSPEDLANMQAESLILNLRVLSTLSNQLGGRYSRYVT